MGRYAYVNGRYVDHLAAQVHIEDRGYQLADGVYEVVGVRDGRLIDEGPHLDRLDRSLKELRIGWPIARSTISFVIRELMRRNRLRDGLVYMQVTRGVARRDQEDQAAGRRGGRRCCGEEPSRHPLGALRHQDGRAPAQCLGQAGGPREWCLRGLADRR
jgi:hypothetical protein